MSTEKPTNERPVTPIKPQPAISAGFISNRIHEAATSLRGYLTPEDEEILYVHAARIEELACRSRRYTFLPDAIDDLAQYLIEANQIIRTGHANAALAHAGANPPPRDVRINETVQLTRPAADWQKADAVVLSVLDYELPMHGPTFHPTKMHELVWPDSSTTWHLRHEFEPTSPDQGEQG